MKLLQFPDTGAGGGRPVGTRDFERSRVSQPLICGAKYRLCSGGDVSETSYILQSLSVHSHQSVHELLTICLLSNVNYVRRTR